MAQARTSVHGKYQYPGKMTFEEYLEWSDHDTDAEWVDGEVVWMSPVTLDNGDLTLFLGSVLRHFVEHNNLGYVFCERVLMRLDTRPSGREPDVVFVAAGRRSILKKGYIHGAADLVVEVVGEESQVRDRQDKYHEYERAGVAEYWIVDAESEQALFFQRDAAGMFQPVPLDGNGVYHSEVLAGLWLRVDWLWQRPLPPLLSVLREWKII